MKKIDKIRRIIITAVVVLVFSIIILYANFNKAQKVSSNTNEGQLLTFSRESGFYADSFEVELETDLEAEIYYTLDGSKPAPDNPEACKYEKKIKLEAGEAEYACTLRAAIFKDNVMLSEVESRTYLIGTDVRKRYDIPVLAVAGDPEDFYNYEDGILVRGKLDDEFIAQHPEWMELVETNMIQIPGNVYQNGREAEKEVFVALFDEEGSQILAQNCGFRVYGAASRMKNQPSFRLYARSEYDEDNDFDYLFFSDQYTCQNALQSDFKRVIVRNGGNDNGYAFIRSELATRIAKQAGFRDTPSASPVCVYLNGEYYGVHWFVTNFDDSYFRQTYGEYTGKMYIFEGELDEVVLGEEDEDTVYRQLAEQYNDIMDSFEDSDLKEEANWQALNAVMDVDNFIKYCALHHYICNDDSLENNFRVYRYYAPDGKYTPGTVFDGRYRFLLFDLDKGLGLMQKESEQNPVAYKLTAERIVGEDGYEEIFAQILQREDCRKLYIQYTLALMNYYYSLDYLSKVLDEMHMERDAELKYMVENTDLLVNNFYAPDVTDYDYVQDQVLQIKAFALQRPQVAIQDLQDAFGAMTPYTLQLSNSNEARITVDYAVLCEKEYTGTYFAQIPVQISVQPKAGYEFVHWLVNKEVIEESSFTVEASQIINGEVTIVCVCEAKEDADLCISGVKAKGGDFIEITNLSEETKKLGSYCLSDKTFEEKSTLPKSIVMPGETVRIYCDNYTQPEALGQPGVDFSIKVGETISLYRTDGSLVDSIEVSYLGSDRGVWQKDMYTGALKEVLVE